MALAFDTSGAVLFLLNDPANPLHDFIAGIALGFLLAGLTLGFAGWTLGRKD